MIIGLVVETYFAQAVVLKKPALVYKSVDTVNPSLACILPHGDVASVFKFGLDGVVLGNHQWIAVYRALHVGVVEVGEGVDERLLFIRLFHKRDEFGKRIAEFGCGQSALRFYVNHRYKVLVAWPALCHEVLQLLSEVGFGPEKVVRTHFQPILMSQLYVAFVPRVDAVATFGGFDVHVCHLRVFADDFPKHLPLIMADVYAVYVVASVFALYVVSFLGISPKRT